MAPRARGSTTVRWVVALSIVGVLVASAALMRRSASLRRDRAIARVVGSGAPLREVDIVPLPRREGLDPLPWARRLEELTPLWSRPHETVEGLTDLFRRIRTTRGLEPSSRTLATLESLEACMEPRVGTWADWMAAARRARVHDPRPTSELDSCQRALLEYEVAAHEGLVELASEASDLGGFHPLQSVQLMPAVQALLTAARRAALDGEYENAVEELGRALAVADLHRGSLQFEASWDRAEGLRRIARELQLLTGLVPHDVDFGSIPQQLESYEFRGHLRLALQHNFVLVMTRPNRDRLPRNLTEVRGSVFQPANLAGYAETVEQFLSWLDLPTWELLQVRPDRNAFYGGIPFYGSWSRGIAAVGYRWMDELIETECLLLLARGALLARREGFEAGAAWAAANLDPYDGRPLRSRVEADGAFTLWSVGPDRVDDGAPDPPTGAPIDWESPDLFWRLRKP